MASFLNLQHYRSVNCTRREPNIIIEIIFHCQDNGRNISAGNDTRPKIFSKFWIPIQL